MALFSCLSGQAKDIWEDSYLSVEPSSPVNGMSTEQQAWRLSLETPLEGSAALPSSRVLAQLYPKLGKSLSGKEGRPRKVDG